MPITLVKNAGLDDAATSTRTSVICEPTAAANQNQLMVTGNWFACTSTDGGGHWTYVDPFTRFPASAGGFCCDQIVQYIPRHRIWVWLLQYSTVAAGDNIFRIAVCRDTSFGSWYYWDFAPSGVDASWTNLWFDYPDMAVTNDNLFVTFNAFQGNAWQRSVLFRFSLATLASGESLNYRWWTTTENGSLRLTRSAGSTMYFGSHNSLAQIRLFEWADGAENVTWTDVDIRTWANSTYSAPGPDNVDWMLRTDGRVTGASIGAGIICFMWTANRDATHPLPYIRVVRINESTKAVLDEPDLWSANSAWAYPAAAANSSGQIGFSAFFGGGLRHPCHVVGVRTATGWDTVLTGTSTHGPTDQSWGDYLSCIAHYSAPSHWVAAGYTLQGGSERKNIEPRYIEFHA
ncbi:hypothetical protein [Belnapia moabensis]|uniref:hypothetical protein n=1 Tax=Belnapia moabensis TaxID=365533 RepID=UPI000694CA2C|nr:hypothetical protein [Belnapia moabensis]